MDTTTFDSAVSPKAESVMPPRSGPVVDCVHGVSLDDACADCEPSTVATFTIVPADDLGALPVCFAVENLTLEQLQAWREKYSEQGTHVILDDRDGFPACLHTIGDEHERCVCGRSTCPDGRRVGRIRARIAPSVAPSVESPVAASRRGFTIAENVDDYAFTIPLDGLEHDDHPDLVAIEVMRVNDMFPDGPRIGYAPAVKATWEGAGPAELEIDDIHDDLLELCDDYSLDAGAVIARMADMIGLGSRDREMDRELARAALRCDRDEVQAMIDALRKIAGSVESD